MQVKAVIIFFSRAGENYINGKKQIITTGNTAILAGKIQQKLNLPVYELTPRIPYSMQYDEVVQKTEEEKQQFAQVDYEELSLELEQVETVFLGFPNWWGTYPRVIAAFLAANNWKNKTIYPFCTHEGSAFGSSIEDLEKSCPGAEIKLGLAVRGSRVEQSGTAVKNWLKTY
ncbi:flavodoxin [Enterococcus pingfangensis]